MTWLKKSGMTLPTITCACVLACGGQIAEQESLASAGGRLGTGVGGAFTMPAAGGALAVLATGGTFANGGALGATSSTSPQACSGVYPIPPLPDGGVGCDPILGKKGGACSVEGAVCYRACGPAASGWKVETCVGGAYAEISVCLWTAPDYSAFRIPATLAEMDPTCPPTSPQAAMACAVAPCISCADPTTGIYLDSSGAAKTGWCTCIGAATGSPHWSCGTLGMSWPCPKAPGC